MMVLLFRVDTAVCDVLCRLVGIGTQCCEQVCCMLQNQILSLRACGTTPLISLLLKPSWQQIEMKSTVAAR